MEALDTLDGPIRPRQIGSPVPVTALQQQLLGDLVRTSVQTSIMRLVVTCVRILGALSVQVLRESLDFLMERHETLRTRIVSTDGTAWQHIDDNGKCCLAFFDLSATTSPELEARQLVQQLIYREIDLSKGPLFEARLLRLSSQEHVLAVVLDHVVCDGVSSMRLNQEIWNVYNQCLLGSQITLPSLPIQFADYAVWQERTYKLWLNKHEGYWRARLVGAPRLKLPNGSDRRLPAPICAHHHFSLGKALTIKLRSMARRDRVPLSTIMLTLYAAVLSRWCNQHDFLVGFVSHGRNRPELANMVGYIANTMYLRIEIEESDTLLSLLKTIELELRLAIQHQDYGRVPGIFFDEAPGLFFNWTPSHWSPIDWSRWSVPVKREKQDGIETLPFPAELTPIASSNSFQFSLAPSDTVAGIILSLVHRSDLYIVDEIEQLLRSVRLFAEEFVANPHLPLALLPLSP